MSIEATTAHYVSANGIDIHYVEAGAGQVNQWTTVLITPAGSAIAPPLLTGSSRSQ